MKDYDLGDKRAGTAVTFTGRGSRDRKGRPALALIVPGLAAIVVLTIGASYLMRQTSSQPSLPSGRPTMANIPTTDVPASSGLDSQPLSASQPAISPSPPTRPQGPPAGRQGAPPSPAGSSRDTQQPPGGPALPSPSVHKQSSTASPAIPAPPSRFRVQAGAFNDRNSAVSLVTRLRDSGYAVTLVEGPPYRVWVGGYLDRTTAEHLAANLQTAGFDAALIPR
jgi:cell division septation protein DedD